MASKTSGGVVETIKTIVYAVVIAVVIRTVFVEPFNIPSGSMEPTLQVGDYLFVSKWSYGYSHFSLPWGFPPFSGRLFARQPERGDVVVFKYPRDTSTDFIKRLIGLPGDRIQVKQGVLYINDEPCKLEPGDTYEYTDREKDRPDFGQTSYLHQFTETLPNGRRHLIALRSTDAPAENTDVFTVPAGHYFMMGDDRDNSSDSRVADSGVGYVPAENLVGPAQFIFFSKEIFDFSSGELIPWWEFWRWPFYIRYGRLLSAIH